VCCCGVGYVETGNAGLRLFLHRKHGELVTGLGVGLLSR
jgi:hypothetical protein